MSAVITARFLLNMRYMEVYPNGTTTVALTTLGIIIESPVSDSDITTKDDDCQYYIYGRDSTESLTDSLPSYNNSMALANNVRVVGCDTENIIPRPPIAALAATTTVTTVVDIRDILEDTFWV